MFSRRSHGDVKKSTQKVLDPKKDVLTRLKHLRALLDNVDASDLKQFFETNYSQIYFIFYENFITLENSLKLKGNNKSQREELDSILFLFEIRCEGIRLFLLWLQALQTNCAEEQVLIFACLVPGFPAVLSSRGPCTLETLINPSPSVVDAKIYPEEITPLLPAVSGEKIAEDQTCFFLQILLKYMVIQTGGGVAAQEKVPELDGAGSTEQDKSHSNSSTLSDRRLSNSSLCSIEEEHRTVYEMVQRILLSTRGYVNFVNEVFRQAFLLPSCEISVTRKVVQVYRKWILQNKPVFMEEPDKKDVAQEDADKLGLSETDSKEASSESSGHKRSSSWGRTYSFTSAMSRGCVTEEDNTNVKAGAQAMLQVFLTNAANVFLLEPCAEVPTLLREQVDACKAVLIIFRRMIMELTMNQKTWEQMLQILLRITEAVMQKPKDKHVKDLFAQSLAGLLFRTLIVAWIRANLCVYISRELWDDFLGVLSSLTEWEELITEWSNIMDSLTAVLARTVYGVEMTNLPLDKLSEQKEKKQRGKGCVLDSQKGAAVGRSFSLSWRSHPDMTEPMRFRSATTSGAPGVEKARNIVRQKATEVEEFQQAESTPTADSDYLVVGQQQVPRSSSTSDITEPLCSDSSQGQKVENSQNLSSSEPRSLQESKEHVKREHEGITILVRRSSSPAELDLKDDLQQTQGRCRERQKKARFPPCQCGRVGAVWQGHTHLVCYTPGWPSVVCCTPGQALSGVLHTRLALGGVLHTRLALGGVLHTWLALGGVLHTWLALGGVLHTRLALGGVLHTRLALDGESTGSDTALGSSNETELPMSPWQTCDEDPELNTPTDAVPDSDARHWLQLSPADASNLTDSRECLADDCSIIAGGNLTGWHPDSAAVLWRRVLGILGDVNNIHSPKIHARVFGYLYDLWYKLAKATTLPNEYKEGKLQAYKLICAMMTRRQDVLPNSDFLVHFYLVMHLGLTSEDQDVLNTIIRNCSPRFFSLGLPGFSMLVGDFITAAARVLCTDMLAAPRAEALTLLGSLVCFPNTYRKIPLLQSVSEGSEVGTGTEDVKHYLINILLKNATEEPNECARCIAICSLGVWICEELTQCASHPQVKDAINVIGVTLKFPNKIVAQVACDVLQLLVSYWEKLQMFETALPRKMAEILVATIAFLLPSAEYSSVETDKKFIVSLLLCLLDWCMALPVNALLHPVSTAVLEELHPPRAPLLDYIYRVLHCCVCGSSTYTQQSHYTLTLADLSSTDYDPFLPLANVRNSEPVQYHSSADLGNLLTVEDEKKRRSVELIPLTARMVMAHLVNHLGHYPLSGGPAMLHSLVSENHDNAHVEGAELSSEVFRSPNLQLFVFNDSTLISYLQTPAEGPDGGTSGASLSDKDLSHSEEGDDALDKLLENIGHTSPECLLPSQLNLNEPSPPPCGMNCDQEKEIIEVILRQSIQEDEYVQRCNSNSAVKVTSQRQPSPVEPRGPFYFCRLLLDDLGMNSWDRSRETHKIAVFYIAEGQEDKCSILANERGSQAYEDFVAGLGWEVDLSTHCGFMGGLQRNGSTGQTAPYYATSTVEVIFHVSTRMPSDSDDSLTKKLRHLGNDEVHIVWSEHSRDYRRGIIPTAFGDVSIIIYPMKNHMFFITITKKPEVPFFGPLFDGAIVSGKLLPSLICATCINASRAVKCLIPLYQSLYLFAVNM
ncbi:Ral GTPase-activating protein subunit alpha-2 [Microtus ochrogaster]|uniref:Ral GTPase-activating protein subunit alpha-2 n=1 Tax=Microtus ochrogaster TaxID=79684 RepID=A0A8J6GP04_MICOH|nr:Ral GTPase-activating protein subunit alpha-2 [Microtus ochrogaster]